MTPERDDRLTLAGDQVHLWFTFPDEIQDRGLLSTYERLMSEEERARRRRFLFARHRHEFLVARALVRTTLSRYAPVSPEAWTFSQNEHGRPDVSGPAGPDGEPWPIRFNLSHTDGLMLVGVVRDREIGVDVEDRLRRVSCLAIADRFFSPAEMRDLHALDLEGQKERFFHYWTLKESYIKARGMGLALPLHSFSFRVNEGAPLRVAFDPDLQDDPAAWQLALYRATERHTAALAVRRGGEPPLSIQIRRVIPNRGERGMPDLVELASSERSLATRP
jgi:4'-phosphopantetheinyl transferase